VVNFLRVGTYIHVMYISHVYIQFPLFTPNSVSLACQSEKTSKGALFSSRLWLVSELHNTLNCSTPRTRTHTCTHARAHTCTHVRTHTHTHTVPHPVQTYCINDVNLCFYGAWGVG